MRVVWLAFLVAGAASAGAPGRSTAAIRKSAEGFRFRANLDPAAPVEPLIQKPQDADGDKGAAESTFGALFGDVPSNQAELDATKLQAELDAAAAKLAAGDALIAALGAGNPDVERPAEKRLLYAGAFAALFALLTLLIVVFKSALASVTNATPRPLRHMLASLFREIAALSFVGLVGYIAVRTGAPVLMGKGLLPGESAGALPLMFNDIHVMLALLVFAYLAIGLQMVAVAANTRRRWMRFESDFRSKKAQKDAMDEYHNSEFGGGPARSCLELIPKLRDAEVKDKVEFFALRDFFIRREVSRPRAITMHLNFAEYLATHLGDNLATMLSVPPSTWLGVMLVLMAAVVGSLVASPAHQIAIFIALGYGMLIAAVVVRAKLNSMQARLFIAPPTVAKGAVTSVEESKDDKEMGAASGARQQDGRWAAHETPFGTSRVPDWDKGSVCGGEVRNIQDSLFWFGHNGPAFLIFFSRLLLVFTAVYVAVYLRIMFTIPKVQFGTGWAVGLCLLALPAPLVTGVLIARILSTLTVLTSIEFNRRPGTVDDVVSRQLTIKAKRAIALLRTTLSRTYHNNRAGYGELTRAVLNAQRAAGGGADAETFRRMLNEGVEACVPDFGADGTAVQANEVEAVFVWLGIDLDSDDVAAMMGGPKAGDDTVAPIEKDELFAMIDVHRLLTASPQIVDFIMDAGFTHVLHKQADGKKTGSVLSVNFAKVCARAYKCVDSEELVRDYDITLGNAPVEAPNYTAGFVDLRHMSYLLRSHMWATQGVSLW